MQSKFLVGGLQVAFHLLMSLLRLLVSSCRDPWLHCYAYFFAANVIRVHESIAVLQLDPLNPWHRFRKVGAMLRWIEALLR